MNKDDIFFDLDCTCPLRKTDIDKILNDYKKNQNLQKLMVLYLSLKQENPYFNLLEKNNKKFLKISKKLKKILFEDRMHRKYMSMLLVCMF